MTGLLLAAAGLMLAATAPAKSSDLCARGDVTEGLVTASVLVLDTTRYDHPMADNRSPSATIGVSDRDGSFAARILYHPTDDALGKPEMLSLRATVPVAAGAEPQPHQIAWQVDGGAWVNPGYWSTPVRVSDTDPRHFIDFKIAEARTYPVRTELLAGIGKGRRIAIRSLDKTGATVAEGVVEVPPQGALEGLFRKANAFALSKLEPCGPPIVIKPAPAFR